MKKKFMRGIAAFLAVLMMVPTAAFADEPGNSGSEQTTPADPTEIHIVVDGESGTLYHDGKNNTLQLKIQEGVDVQWSVPEGSECVSVSSSGLVTAKAPGEALIRAIYNKSTLLSADYIVEVVNRELTDFYVEQNNYIERHYYVGETFDTKGITAYATYSDDSKPMVVTDYSVSPQTLAADTKEVTITYSYNGVTKTAKIPVTVDTVSIESVKITSPANNFEVKKGDKISSVTVEVKYNNGKTETKTTGDSGVTIDGYTLGTAITKDTAITATVGGVTSSPVLIKVKEETTTGDKEINYVTVTTKPTKTTYNVGDTLKLDGMVLTITYGNGTTTTVSYSAYTANDFSGTDTTTKFTQTGTASVVVAYREKTTGKVYYAAPFNVTVTAGASVNVTKLNNSTSGNYKYVLKKGAKIKIGDDDLDWEDFFDSLYIVYKNSSNSTKYEKIEDQRDLEKFLDDDSARLRLVVYDKDKNADEIEEDDVKNGKVTLMLYLDYAGEQYDSSGEYIKFTMDISDVGCTVGIYSSAASNTVYDSIVCDDLTDVFDKIADKDKIDDNFSTSLTSSRVIKIKLGEDQKFEPSSRKRFAPDYENDIIIDLNGYELELKSDWIDYDDCEDIEVTITNSNKDDATLIYTDLGTTLVVEEDAELVFSEGKVPMDSGAEITLTLLRTASSTSALKTKTFEDLRDALKAIEREDDFEDEIGSELGTSNVIKIKLGEDQNLSSYEFAPDYDNSIYIDLNGHTLKLKSEWIDYDDCDDLTVYITNSNKDKDATLTYTDLSQSIKLKQGDSALKFEKDKIPGIYKVAIANVQNGTVKADKQTVTHGGTVTFTITPDTGYAISTVKVGTKTITTSTSGYSVSSRGVGTYKMENVTTEPSITVTFKKSSGTTSSTTTTTDTSDWQNPFTDISTRDQYYDAIAYVVQNGLFKGMTETKFEPKGTTTRAQYVTVLGRLAGVDVSKYKTSSYTDVSTSDQSIAYAVPYIEWATDVGIIQGYGNGKFGPKDNITHQQMYLMMYRYAMFVENISVSLTGVSLSNIRDNSDIADWAEDGVKFASRYGILITSGGKLTPADNALRCELAMLLHGFCTKVMDK